MLEAIKIFIIALLITFGVMLAERIYRELGIQQMLEDK